jgi:hypothetical protein
VRFGVLEKRPRLTVLNNLARIQDNNAIEVQDRIELMRNSNNRVITEFLPNHTLHDSIRLGIDAVSNPLVIMQQGGVYGKWRIVWIAKVNARSDTGCDHAGDMWG